MLILKISMIVSRLKTVLVTITIVKTVLIGVLDNGLMILTSAALVPVTNSVNLTYQMLILLISVVSMMMEIEILDLDLKNMAILTQLVEKLVMNILTMLYKIMVGVLAITVTEILVILIIKKMILNVTIQREALVDLGQIQFTRTIYILLLKDMSMLVVTMMTETETLVMDQDNMDTIKKAAVKHAMIILSSHYRITDGVLAITIMEVQQTLTTKETITIVGKVMDLQWVVAGLMQFTVTNSMSKETLIHLMTNNIILMVMKVNNNYSKVTTWSIEPFLVYAQMIFISVSLQDLICKVICTKL